MSDDRDLELRIAKLQLAPGDILVVKSEQRLTMDAAERLKEHLRQFRSPDIKVLILDGGIDLTVLTRAEIEARAA